MNPTKIKLQFSFPMTFHHNLLFLLWFAVQLHFGAIVLFAHSNCTTSFAFERAQNFTSESILHTHTNASDNFFNITDVVISSSQSTKVVYLVHGAKRFSFRFGVVHLKHKQQPCLVDRINQILSHNIGEFANESNHLNLNGKFTFIIYNQQIHCFWHRVTQKQALQWIPDNSRVPNT